MVCLIRELQILLGNQAIGEIQGVEGDNVTETSNEEPKNGES